MDYVAAVIHLYPAAQPLRDFAFADEGQGIYLSHWDAGLGTPPTMAELQQAWSDMQLPGAQASKVSEIYAAFQGATYADIAITNTAGVAATYQADELSRARISRSLASYSPVGATPAGFYWVDTTNIKQPTTLVDLQEMAKAIADREWGYFQHLQDLKGQVEAATSLAEVAAVVW